MRIAVVVVVGLLALTAQATAQPGGVYEPDPYYEAGPSISSSPWVVIGLLLLGAAMTGLGDHLDQRRKGRWGGVLAFAFWIGLVGLLIGVSGCGGARIALPSPDSATRAELNRMFGSPVELPRGFPPARRVAVVDRVDNRLRPAVVAVCQRTFNDPQNCAGRISQCRLVVDPYSEGINASVGDTYDITVLGGLVGASGSDDEIALVPRHV